jgi:thioredoxin 1
MPNVIEPTNTEQARALLGAEGVPVLVDFSATWCGPCKALSPVLEAFATERVGKLNVVKLDVDQFSEIAGEVGIRSVPTLMVVRDGQVLAAQAGSLPKPMLAAFVDRALA